MQTTLQGIVTGISKYEMNEGATKGASLFMIQKTSGRNPNIIGQETLKLRLPFDMFEEFRHFQDAFNSFSQFQIDADVEAGGAGRPAITVIAIREVKQTTTDKKPVTSANSK